MMPPPSYMYYARAGDHHVQVEVLRRDVSDDRPLESTLTAKVRRVFRSSLLRVGDQVRFGVKTYRKPNSFPPDAGGWIEADCLNAVDYLEVILNGPKDACTIAAFGALHRTIESPTDQPTIKVPSWAKVVLASVAFSLHLPVRPWTWRD